MRFSSCGLCVVEVSRWLLWKVEPFLLVFKDLLEQSFTPTTERCGAYAPPFLRNHKSPITCPPQDNFSPAARNLRSQQSQSVRPSYFAARMFEYRTPSQVYTYIHQLLLGPGSSQPIQTPLSQLDLFLSRHATAPSELSDRELDSGFAVYLRIYVETEGASV
jgi:hypothetical protein